MAATHRGPPECADLPRSQPKVYADASHGLHGEFEQTFNADLLDLRAH
ncbi:hypothetical protein ABZ942_17055 [Nocardia sp. NPDC046473]